MLYLVQTANDVLYQGFDKYAACDIYHGAVNIGTESAYIWHGDELVDWFDPLDLTIEQDDFTLDWDDCEVLEFLL